MKTMAMRHMPFAVVAVLSIAAMAVVQAAAQDEEAGTQAAPPAVFTDEVEVNVVNLYVSVVDRDGDPVTGLGPHDFIVEESGQPMEITNFSDMGTVEVGMADVVAGESAGDAAADVAGRGDAPTAQVAVVFDETGLEKRQRKRVLKALVPWVGSTTAGGGQIMVASLEPELKIVQPFTSDPSLVISALEEVAERETTGDMVKSNKRLLTRQIQAAQTISSSRQMADQAVPLTRGGGGGGGTGGSSGSSGGTTLPPQVVNSGALGRQQATNYLGQIEMLRRQEYGRVGQTLIAMDKLIRGLTGLPGRKDVLWVTEDLMLRPGLDLYEVFFTKFNNWTREMNLEQPQVWSSELTLDREFQYIAGVSQISGTVLHVVDASDRDREVASADFSSADAMSQMNANPRGSGATGGYDFSATRSLVEGSQYLSGATGGSFLGGTRNFDDYFERLGALLASYYSIGYRRSEPADGKLHEVSVKVTRDGLRVLTHERVPNPTEDQRLANIAISQLLIHEGPNPLGLSVSLGPSEPAEEDRYIQEIQLQVPARNLLLVERDGNHVGTLAVAVVAADSEDNPMPPRLLQLTVALPSDRLTEATIAMARLRLMMEQQSDEVAVAVRDQGSGTEASALVHAGI